MCWCSKAGWLCWFSLLIRRLKFRCSGRSPRRSSLSSLDWFKRRRSLVRFSVVFASLTLLVQLIGPAVAVNRHFEKTEREADWQTLDRSSPPPPPSIPSSSRHVSPLMSVLSVLPSHPLLPSDASASNDDHSSWSEDVDEKRKDLPRRVKEGVPSNPGAGSESSRHAQSMQREKDLPAHVDDKLNFGEVQTSVAVPVDQTYFRLSLATLSSAESIPSPDVATLSDSSPSSPSSDLHHFIIPSTPRDEHSADTSSRSSSSADYDEEMSQTTWTISNELPSNTRDVQTTAGTWSSDRRKDVTASTLSHGTKLTIRFQSLREDSKGEAVTSDASSAGGTQSAYENNGLTNASPLVTEGAVRTHLAIAAFAFDLLRPRRRQFEGSKGTRWSDAELQTEGAAFSRNISEPQTDRTAALFIANSTDDGASLGPPDNEGIFSNTTSGLKDNCTHQFTSPLRIQSLNQTSQNSTIESLFDLLLRSRISSISSKCLPPQSSPPSGVDGLSYSGGGIGVVNDNDNRRANTSYIQEKLSSSSPSSSSSLFSSSLSSSSFSLSSQAPSNRTLAFCDRVSYCWRSEDKAADDGFMISNEVHALDDQVQKMFKRFLDVLLISFDCEDRYSSIWTCQSCKVNNFFPPIDK